MNVKLISVTQGAGELIGRSAQELISYEARVSSPSNQGNMDTAAKLISYLIKHKHWSPLEMVHMTVEITTSRAIAQQILRHRSFSFQEFSQRYALANDYVSYEARRQDEKNRQNSIDDMSDKIKGWFNLAQERVWERSKADYDHAISMGIAKEQARFLLPLNTQTRMYMCGSARSWVHYLELRTDVSTQKEHRDISCEIRDIFIQQFPDVAKALGWA